MRKALISRPLTRTVASGVSVPAPVGGWDANAPLADMEPDRAIQLDNYFPAAHGVELRRGYWLHAAGMSAVVETLMAYHAPLPANNKLFAVSGGEIHDVSSSGSVGAFELDGLANSRFQFVNLATAGGQFLWACNGADIPIFYDGTSWTNAAITGVTSTSIVNVALHKHRLWFCLNNSLDAAYLPVDSIQGAATVFPLGPVFSRGGYLVAIGSWSTDAGTAGMDDMAVFVSSRGQIAVYGGTDPDDTDNWHLVGVYNLGPPLGRRCLLKVASDLALITQDGVLPLSQAINRDRGALEGVALTTRVRNAMSSYARLYGRNFGWQLAAYPTANMAILNVPVSENALQYQVVMNTVTGAWCRFTGQNAACWETYDDGLYFGTTNGVVHRADVSDADFDNTITADMRGAFSNVKAPGILKRFNLIEPIISADRDFGPAVGIDTDYRDSGALAALGGEGGGGALWDAVDWDAFTWGQELTTTETWNSASGLGEVGSVKMRVVIPAASRNPAFWDVGLWDEGTWGASRAGTPGIFQVHGFRLIYEKGGLL